MVTRKKNTGEGKVKVDKLKVNKETVKDLGEKEAKKIKGGMKPIYTDLCTKMCQTVGCAYTV